MEIGMIEFNREYRGNAMVIKSKMPGKIIDIKVKAGDGVKKGDLIMVMEAMKMKNPIPTPAEGTVKEITVGVGDRVNPGDVLAVIE
jgi:biotin carboxyl carrier protein